jgi:PAT family beta-lactamase induction signal transducer AmpG
MGAGVGVWVLGYRIAMIVSGGVALMIADMFSWPLAYVLMGVLMAAAIPVTIFSPEPEVHASPPSTLRDAVRLPFMEFFGRMGASRALSILTFIVLYRLGDSMILNMTTPFLLQTGFSQADVGAIQGGAGVVATILGVLAGGAVLSRIGITRSLWVFGGLQAISNLAYWGLALSGRNYPVMVSTIIIENLCTGLGTAAFLAFLMSLCNPQFSATQYALLSSVFAVTRDILVAPVGAIVEVTGWPLFFLISFAAALPALMLLPFFASKDEIGGSNVANEMGN